MKLKYSKLKDFKLVTGHHLLELQGQVRTNNPEESIKALQTITLGLYLIDSMDIQTARREFTRLSQPDNEAELFDIIDNVDVQELLDDVIQ